MNRQLPKVSIKFLVRYLRENNFTFNENKMNIIVTSKGLTLEVTYDIYMKAKQIIDAEEFVNGYKKAGGKFIAERLRDGFIGMEVSTNIGTKYIQSIRGKPFGTVVSIPTKDNDVVLGMSYIDVDNEKYPTAIVGLAMALKRAIEGYEHEKHGVEQRNVRSRARKQIEHFYKRSLAYFVPEIYSRTRGTNPVIYDNYEEIHARRKLILGDKA